MTTYKELISLSVSPAANFIKRTLIKMKMRSVAMALDVSYQVERQERELQRYLQRRQATLRSELNSIK